MSLLEELRQIYEHPATFGSEKRLGLRIESKPLHTTKSAERVLADFAYHVLHPSEDELVKKNQQNLHHLLLEQEIEVTIHAYPVHRTTQTKEEEKQGIRGKIYLIERNAEGEEVQRTLWRLIVDVPDEDGEEG